MPHAPKGGENKKTKPYNTMKNTFYCTVSPLST